MLDFVISGLSDRFEPDATAVHLANIENFLIGERENSDHIARTDKDDINWPRLTSHRDLFIDRAMSTGHQVKSFNDVVELLKYEVFRELVQELTNLVKIILSLLASTFTAGRSFFGLKRLKTYLGSGMKQQRLDSMAIMNVYKKEIKALSIATLIDDFACRTSVRTNTFYSTKP